MIVDTSVIYALLDSRDGAHDEVVEWYRVADPEFETTPFVLAEMDHMAGRILGANAQRAWRADVAAGVYRVEWWDTAAVDSIAVADRYADLAVGITDGSLVALADRMGVVEIATLDQRHFRAMAPLSGESFILLPMDS